MIAHNLPNNPSPFIGRAHELEEIARLMQDPSCRQVTLVGPGGTGKTRLALEVAKRLSPSQENGERVSFVPLQPLTSPELIVTAIADAMNFCFYSDDDPLEQLLAYLEWQKGLLILDNFEHLLDGAYIISEILTYAPGIKLLVTSRERLNLVEEWVFEVSGLSYPTPSNGTDRDAYSEYSAVQLFVQNARRARPGFTLDNEHEAIARICALVSGMPLAIELASSWVRALSCAEIATEIERGLDILETPARNMPPRHRNMRAVLDHSWQLLTDFEAEVFIRLSIFRGGFTRHAAQVVAGASLGILSALVDKSWLRHDPATGRYDVHELLRQYAEERLEQSTCADPARKAHAAYYADFMQQQEQGIKFRRQIEALNDIERDFENIRIAWQYAAEQRDAPKIRQMAEGLHLYCDMKARFVEAEAMFRTAAQQFAESNTFEHRVAWAACRLRRVRMILLGSVPRNDSLESEIDTLIQIARESGDLAELGFAFYASGMMRLTHNSWDDAREHLTESLDIYTELQDRFYMAEMIVLVGVTKGDANASRDHFIQANQLQREIGDMNGLSWTLNHLARSAFSERRYADSEVLAAEALNIQRQRDDRKGLCSGLLYASERNFSLGNFELARDQITEALMLAQDLHIQPMIQTNKAMLGLIKIMMEEDIKEGERLCREAISVQFVQDFNMGEPLVDSLFALIMRAYEAGEISLARQYYRRIVEFLIQFKDEVAFLYSRLAPIAVLVLAGDGRSETAVELLSNMEHLPDEMGFPIVRFFSKAPISQRLTARLRAELSEAAYDAAWERGKTANLKKWVEDLLGYWVDTPSYPISPTALKSLEFESIGRHSRQVNDYRIAASKDGAWSAALASPSTTAALVDPLTDRELEILRLVADGLSNRDVANQLVLAIGTVKWYLNEIYTKFGVTSRTQAIARARDLGLIA